MSKELAILLKQVISSWQVIAVTIALLLYISLINRVTRRHNRPRSISKAKPRRKKPTPAASGPEVVAEGGDVNKELGLEEA